jgi:hypothetical protein
MLLKNSNPEVSDTSGGRLPNSKSVVCPTAIVEKIKYNTMVILMKVYLYPANYKIRCAALFYLVQKTKWTVNGIAFHQ